MIQSNTSDGVLLSKVISFLRFPLIVAVVLIHVDMDNVIGTISNDKYLLFINVDYVLSQIFAAIAVPLFFFFSGFLFFYKHNVLTVDIYKQKIKKRAKSLLLPYIFWNALFVIVYFIGDKIVPGSGDLHISEWGLDKYLMSFWMISEGHPANFPLWFIRDLMIVVLFSPLLYYIIIKSKKIGVFLLALLWLFSPKDFTISLFFFTLGSYFSVNKINFVTKTRPYLRTSIVMYIIMAILILYLKEDILVSKILIKLSILIGLTLVISVSSFLIQKRHWYINEYISSANFFVYAYHAIMLLLVSVIEKIIFTYIPINNISLFIVYISKLLVLVVVGVLIHHFMQRYFPRFTSLITGGR